MWERKGAHAGTRRGTLLRTEALCLSDFSSDDGYQHSFDGEESATEPAPAPSASLGALPSRSSRAVQVPSPGTAMPGPVESAGGARTGRVHRKARMMLSAKRWASRRRLVGTMPTTASSASESPVGSPESFRRRKAPTLAAGGVRRRRSFSLPERPMVDETSGTACRASLVVANPAACLSSPSLLNPARRGATKTMISLLTSEVGEAPISPATSTASDATRPGWAALAVLADGVAKRGERTTRLLSSSSLGDNSPRCDDRDVPRFLRPVLLLSTLSILAIVGAKLGRGIGVFGPAVHAAGGVQLPEAVVDDIFDRADKDHDGVIADEEIHHLVEGAGGARLDDAKEIAAGVASVIKHLDLNADHTLSRSDLLTYWRRLGTLLTVDEVAEWVVHAAQLPPEVADIFRSNMVTGYDFPELAARQGELLEKDLGVTRPAFRKRLVRSMKWKLWGMGEEPAAPEGLRAANASCGALSLEWDRTEGNLSFPVHKFVLRRALLGERGETAGSWETVMDGSNRAFFDARLKPGGIYKYSLQAWNALGHSSAAELDVQVATRDCVLQDYWWSGGGVVEASMLSLVGAAFALLVGALYVGVPGGKRMGRLALKNGTLNNNDDGRCPKRPEVLSVITGTEGRARDDQVALSSAPAEASPISLSSNEGWSDRDTLSERRRSSPSCMLAKSTHNLSARLRSGSTPKDRMKKGASVGAGIGQGVGGGRGSHGGGGGGGRDPRPDVTVAVESIRKEAARRLMSRQSNSLEEKEVCNVCKREWKWFRRGKHTCCKCHELFCDRCGIASHAFWACPVGGSCMCSDCLVDERGLRA